MVTISPNISDFTPLGRNATFTCTSDPNQSGFLTVVVTDEAGIRLASVNNDDLEKLKRKHIHFDFYSEERITWNVLGTKENNNTVVVCRVSTPGTTKPLSFSEELNITVIG